MQDKINSSHLFLILYGENDIAQIKDMQDKFFTKTYVVGTH